MVTLNRDILQKMAIARLEDARVLLNNGRFAAAYYVAGYSVECGLKACFARQTKEFDFPEYGKADRIFQHDVEKLAGLAGLKQELANDQDQDPDFKKHWVTVAKWNETARYDPLWVNDPVAMQKKAEDMIRAIDEPAHGVLIWLQKHW